MPYIDYDKNGQITGQFANQQYDEQIYTDLVIDDVDKFKVIQNVVIDISDTKEYKDKKALEEQKTQAMKNITKRQLLFWLYTHKQKTEDDIFTAIDTITDTSKKYLAKVSYSGTNNFYYGNEYTQAIGLALGLTIEELKQCFDEANKL